MKYIALLLPLIIINCTVAKSSVKSNSKAVFKVDYEKKRIINKEVFDLYHANNDTDKNQKDFNWKMLSKTTAYSLFLNEDESLFKKNVGLRSNIRSTSSSGTTSYTEHENFYYRNLNEPNTLLATQGENYVIQDSLVKLVWNTNHSDFEDVLGYKVHKATAVDSVSNSDITAWYAKELPFAHGPHIYWGLEGLILKVEVRRRSNTSTSDLRAIEGSVFQAVQITPTQTSLKKIDKANKRVLTSQEHQKELNDFLQRQRKMNAGGVDTSI